MTTPRQGFDLALGEENSILLAYENNMIGSEYRLNYHSTCYLHTDLHRLAARCRGSGVRPEPTDWAGYVAGEIKLRRFKVCNILSLVCFILSAHQ